MGGICPPSPGRCRVDPLTGDRIRQVYREEASGTFDDGCSASPMLSDIGWGITFPGIHDSGSRLACFVYLSRIHHPRPLWVFTTSTPEKIAAAPQLEPSFDMTLRAADISEEVVTGFRIHRIKNAATCTAMGTTPEELKDTVREAFGVETAKHGLPHKVEWANIHNPWLAAKSNLEVKTRVDEAVARAHGQPIQYLTKDWASMLFQFKTQSGLNIQEAKLPSQSYYGWFEERLHNGVLEAETLAHVVSLEEEREQMASKTGTSHTDGFTSGFNIDPTDKEKVPLTYAYRSGIITYEIQSDDQSLVARTASSTWSSALRRPLKGYVQ